MTAEIHRLSNNIPVLIDVTPHSQAMSTAVYFPVGAAHETDENNGVAHFLEHMAFKGTKKRSSRQIATDVENLGASSNAFTGYERTAYHINGLARDSRKVIGVLADIVINSVLPEEEVERERGTILQEIGMYADDPGSSMWHNATATAYPGQSYGRPILGPAGVVGAMTRGVLSDFRSANYHAGNMVVGYAGNADPSRILADFEKSVGRLKPGTPTALPDSTYRGGIIHEERPTQQLQLGVMFNAYASTDKRNPAAALMARILGSGFSSRMFTEIREKRGLVYSTFAVNEASQHGGLTSLFAGTGPAKIAELMPVLADEVRKMAHDLVTPEELARAKKRITAQILSSEDSVSGRMHGAVQAFMTHGRVIDQKEIMAKYKAVTAQQVRDAAQDIFSSDPVISTIGPGGNVMSREEFKARLAL